MLALRWVSNSNENLFKRYPSNTGVILIFMYPEGYEMFWSSIRALKQPEKHKTAEKYLVKL